VTSLTQRSLATLRAAGWYAAVVEHWNPHAHIRQDLFGIGDIIAVRSSSPGCALIQCTSGSNVSARVKKILDAPVTMTWLAAGNVLAVWGWVKKGPRGKRKVWTLTTRNITARDVRDHLAETEIKDSPG